MKVVLSGGGSGGHIYPLFAVAEEIIVECGRQGIEVPSLYFYSDKNYYPEMLIHLGIQYRRIFAGKSRTYKSFENVLDMFITIFGIFATLYKMMAAYPDIIFAKGGYASFPVLLAARILGIPVIVHESDTVGGRVTTWASKFALRSAFSFAKAAANSKLKNAAHTGQPIISELIPPTNYNKEFYYGKPILLIIGGSQGSQTINTLVYLSLLELLEKYNIVHIVGDNNLAEAERETQKILENNINSKNYVLYGHVSLVDIYPKVDIAVSRAGATTIFELALWQIPTVFIPLAISHDNHQAENAFEAVKAGWAKSLEESNLSPHMLLQSLDSICENVDTYNRYSDNAKGFGNRDAANIIAVEILNILKTH